MSVQEVFLQQQYPKAMEDLPSPEIGSLTELHTCGIGGMGFELTKPESVWEFVKPVR